MKREPVLEREMAVFMYKKFPNDRQTSQDIQHEAQLVHVGWLVEPAKRLAFWNVVTVRCF